MEERTSPSITGASATDIHSDWAQRASSRASVRTPTLSDLVEEQETAANRATNDKTRGNTFFIFEITKLSNIPNTAGNPKGILANVAKIKGLWSF